MLTLVKDLGMRSEVNRPRRWCIALCSYCATEVERRTQDLKTKQSCGCATHLKAVVKHNMSYDRLYQTWADMKTRCTQPRNKRYHKYGGRGIVVCAAWQEFTSFRDWALANGYTDELTIDRIDNDGNYEPGNCEWITIQENLRRRNKYHGWKNATTTLCNTD